MVKCIILVIVALILALVAEGQSQNFCQLVVDCIREVGKIQQQCDSLKQANNNHNRTISSKKPTKEDKCSISEIQNEINEKMDEQKTMYADCMQLRLAHSFKDPSVKGTKKKQCLHAVEKFQNATYIDTTIQTKTASEEKLTFDFVDQTVTTAGSNTNRSVLQSVDFDDQGQVTGNNTADFDKGKGKGSSGSRKGKGSGSDKSKGSGGSSLLIQQCKHKAHKTFHECKKIAECCSETTICQLEFELTSLHDDIRKLQLDIATKRNDCAKTKLSQILNFFENSTSLLEENAQLSGHSMQNNKDT